MTSQETPPPGTNSAPTAAARVDAVTLVRRLHEHQHWATDRLLAAADGLSAEQLRRSFAIGQGSLLATLVHLYAAELVWLDALEGNPDPGSPWAVRFDDLAGLRTAWAALRERWRTYLGRLAEVDLARPVVKRSTSSGAGRTFATPAYDVLLHLPTHAQYTAAQAKNMLRQLGVDPLPDLMLITLSRSQHPAIVETE